MIAGESTFLQVGDVMVGTVEGLGAVALGAIVFRDPAARGRLGAIMHPQVGAEMGRRLAAARWADVSRVATLGPISGARCHDCVQR